jgi:nicotinamide mononucleotide adenylyltransferase
MKHCEAHVIRAVNLWCCPYQFMAISLGIPNIGKTQATYSLLIHIYIYTVYIYIVYIFCKYEYMSIHVYKYINKYIPLYQHSITTWQFQVDFSKMHLSICEPHRFLAKSWKSRWGWSLGMKFEETFSRMVPSGNLTVRHGIDGPNRNRWFTVLKNGDFPWNC